MPDQVAIPPETLAAFDGDELRARIFLEKYALRDLDDRIVETLPQQMWDRATRELASVEATPELRERWRREFRWLLDGFRFLPGGRILHGVGNLRKVTLLNCYFTAIRGDSLEDIYTAAYHAAKTYSRGGGIGIDVTPLRPAGSPVHNAARHSTGAVSFMELFSLTTGLIGQCLAEGTPVLTSRGWATIEDVRSGDRVWTHRGWRLVTHCFPAQTRDVFLLRTRRGYTLRLSADHKLAIVRDGRLSLVPLRDLGEGSAVLLVRGQEAPDATPQPLLHVPYERNPYNDSNRLAVISQPPMVTPDLAYWLGFYTGNGTNTLTHSESGELRSVETCIVVRGGRHRTVERLCNLTRTLFGLQPRVDTKADGDCVRVRIGSKWLYEWLRANGLVKGRSTETRVPEAVRKSPDDVVAAFLAGLFDADGSPRGQKGGYRFSTASPGLADDIRLELLRLGVVTITHVEDRSHLGWAPIHTVAVVGRSAQEAFLASVGRHGDRTGGFLAFRDSAMTPWTIRDLGIKRTPATRYVPTPPQKLSVATLQRYAAEHGLAADGTTLLIEDDIAEITPLGPATTYDIEVEDTHKFSAGGLYVSNSGRRGALMLTIADHHPDVLEFCRVKRNLTSVRFANISVRLSDTFMHAVEQDRPWMLWFDAPETGRIERTIRARELWDELTTGARDWAEPGCLFWDRVISYGTSNYGGMTPQGTNPCLVASTRIAASEGLVTIADLAARPSALPDAVLDTRVSRAPGRIIRAWKTGRKAVVRIETREGYQLRATPDHRILTENRGWVRSGDLAAGDVLLVQNRKGGFGARGTRELGLALGWLVADGTIDKSSDRAILQFYGDKRALAPILQGAVASCVASASSRPAPVVIAYEPSDRDEVKSRRLLNRLVEEGFDPSSKHRIPELIWQGTEDTARGFLQAVFTADGTVVDASDARKSVRLSSANLEFLRDVQVLLANFGIASRIYVERRPASRVPMPDGHGGSKPYQCMAAHELVIGRSNIAAFAREIGFLAPSPKQQALDSLVASYTKGPYRERFTARVLRVVPDGEEDVYDLHEATSNAFTANAITVHNCSEIPLENGGACNLGSLNLATFVLDPFAPTTRLDTDALDRAVRAAIRFLDNVLTYNEGKHALPEQEEAARRGRRIGLGIAGLGDALAMLGLHYDSPEAIRAAGDIMRRIKETAYRASVELAREKGPFSAFDADLHLAQAFFATFPQDLLDDIRRHGLRNVSLLTIPPTGSISAMAGITNGLEPIFALSYIRRSESLSQEFFHVLHPLVHAYLERAGQAIDETKLARARDPHAYLKERLPDAFVTAHEIDPLKRVDMQAALQAHIDQSISSTVNLPREATAETVERVYFHAWRRGLKGISVYREGSREGVLLTPEEARRQHKLVALAETVRATALAAAPDLALDGGAPEEQIASAVRALADRLKGSPVQLHLATPTEAEPLMQRPRDLSGTTYRVPTATGTMFVTINELDGQPVEVFCRLGKGGSHAEADSEMAGRLISVALRLQTQVPRTERLRLIQEQLEGIGGGDPYGFGPNKVKSIADAIAKAIGWHLNPKRESADPALAQAGAAVPAAEPSTEPHGLPVPITGGSNGNLCPQCHQYSLITDQGCTKCRECSYKEC